MASRLLKNESYFAGMLGFWLSGNVPKEQRKELEQMFSLDYNGLTKACNRYMQRTIKALDKGILTLDGFSVLDDEKYSALLTSNRLNKDLQKRFFQLIQEKSHFVETMSSWLLGELSGEQKERFEKMFRDECENPISACNRYMKRTIRQIKRGFFNRDKFANVQYAKTFGVWLNSEKLDKDLQVELSHLLYGADERKRY